jgi:hypothetical protein
MNMKPMVSGRSKWKNTLRFADLILGGCTHNPILAEHLFWGHYICDESRDMPQQQRKGGAEDIYIPDSGRLGAIKKPSQAKAVSENQDQ